MDVPQTISGEGELLSSVFDELFPICRSITGPGYRESLKILSNLVPIENTSIPTGPRVFDWEIPKERRIRSAWLKDPQGKIIADFGQCNLSVVNYSAPVHAELSLDELRPHLHSDPSSPDAIPYVTSYYNEVWGFCLSHRLVQNLLPGKYTAHVDSEFVPGEVTLGHTKLSGNSSKVILISSYLCHPSMANNELSGPLVLAALYRRLKQWKGRHYTYEFLINPETIGSLAFLSLHAERLRNNLHAGLVLTCLGGPEPKVSYKQTIGGDALIDRLARHFAAQGRFELRPYSPIGSDERQYNAPAFRLPVGQVARTIYANFPQYHSSLDTKETMGIDPLLQAVEDLEMFFRCLEYARPFENLCPYGEPQLGRRGLYPTLNSPSHRTKGIPNKNAFLDAVFNIFSYTDGATPMLEIAERMSLPLESLIPIIDQLVAAQLIK